MTSLSILVAEDNAINRAVLTATLGRVGHRPHAVGDGAAAVAAVEGREFDLVLMDLDMPLMDGYAATRALRNHPSPSVAALPILALTATLGAAEVRACREARMNGCLVKPLTPDSLAYAWSELEAGRFVLPAHGRVEGEAALAPLVDEDHLRNLAEDIPNAVFARSIEACRLSAAQSAADLTAAWEEGRTADLARIAHKLKGTAGTYGLRRLWALASEIEVKAAGAGDGLASLVEEAEGLTRATLERLAALAP